MKFTIAVGVIATVASCASAFVVPAPAARSMAPAAARSSVTQVNGQGKYDGELWDDAAKKDQASMYDSSKPRSETNFDPYEKDAKGNSCDPSGYYPGEGKYKDPVRPTVSFEEYLKQKAEKDAKN